MDNILHKTNILYVTYSLNTGGLEKLILELARRIDRKIFSPSICSFEKDGRLRRDFKENGIPVYTIEKKGGTDFSLPLRLARLIKTRNINIIHTNDATPWLYGALARLLSPRVKLVHTEHLNVPANKKLLIYAEKWLEKLTHVTVADSKYIAEFLNENSRIKKGRIKVVYNGIDVDKFVNQRTGTGSRVKAIGVVARLAPQKGHDTLLKAFKLLTDKIEDVELLIIGDGILRPTLESLAGELGLSKKVKFMGERNDIDKILQQLDIFVISSLNEGLSIAILEAMASALPVVATEVGGNPELILDGQTGILVPSSAPEKLAEALRTLLSDKQKAIMMGQAGRKRVVEYFSINNMVKEYQEIYKQLS